MDPIKTFNVGCADLAEVLLSHFATDPSLQQRPTGVSQLIKPGYLVARTAVAYNIQAGLANTMTVLLITSLALLILSPGGGLAVSAVVCYVARVFINAAMDKTALGLVDRTQQAFGDTFPKEVNSRTIYAFLFKSFVKGPELRFVET